MAVTLRLSRTGVRGNACYRIVASTKGSKRDGKFLEVIGTFYPMVNPPKLTMKEDRMKHWIEQGALPTSVVRDIIRKSVPGYIEGKEDHRRKKIQAARKARKARMAKSSGGKTAKTKAKKA